MSDDVRADARRDLESDRAFLDGTSRFDAPGAGYRLNTWVQTRIPTLLAELDRVTSQRDQAIELGGDIDLLASASLRTLANQRDAAIAMLRRLYQASEYSDSVDEGFLREVGEFLNGGAS